MEKNILTHISGKVKLITWILVYRNIEFPVKNLQKEGYVPLDINFDYDKVIWSARLYFSGEYIYADLIGDDLRGFYDYYPCIWLYYDTKDHEYKVINLSLTTCENLDEKILTIRKQ